VLLNPYIAGNPLRDSSAFYGRDDVVREVMQMLNHPDEKAIVLFGQRRIGKTTILLQIDRKLTEERKFTPVYFDLQDRASSTLSDVLYKLAQAISYRLKQPLPSIDKFDANGDYFIKEFLPATIKFSAPNGLVILFDEFDVMDSPENNRAGQAFFPYLRSFITSLEHAKFVFVIGRRPEELSTDTLSTFKGIRATKVSLLSRNSTELVIRQSENKESLFWSNESVEQIWKWTQGHTYFTQLICSVIWEHLQERATGKDIPTVAPSDVDDAIHDAMKQGSNAFHWIWGGLPPAERVVMAAMAEAKSNVISQEEIEDILNQSGVRLIVRELKIAPMTLIDWGLLRSVENNYRFAVPLLREWVKSNRPLIRVKEELDRLDPLAENLFQTGQHFYNLGKKDDAIQQLRQALNTNPNHLKSRVLVGRILFESGTPESIIEAVQILDEGYKYDKIAVEADYIKVLLAYSETKDTDEQKMEIYDQILGMRPNQNIASERRNAIWIARGEEALQKGDYTTALKAFGEADDKKRIALVRQTEQQKWQDEAETALAENNLERALELFQLAQDDAQIKHVTALIDQKWINDQLNLASQAEKGENWEKAIQVYSSVLERFPDHETIPKLLKNAQEQSHISQLYKQAIQQLISNHPENAKSLFLEIMQAQPDYKDTARYVYEIVDGAYLPVKQTSVVQKAVPFFSKVGLIIIVWVGACGILSALTTGVSMLFQSNSNVEGVISTLGLLLAILLATGIAIYTGVYLFQKKSRDRRKR
jgi:tetratricopeptide (TPR) repeat protein